MQITWRIFAFIKGDRDSVDNIPEFLRFFYRIFSMIIFSFLAVMNC